MCALPQAMVTGTSEGAFPFTGKQASEPCSDLPWRAGRYRACSTLNRDAGFSTPNLRFIASAIRLLVCALPIADLV